MKMYFDLNVKRVIYEAVDVTYKDAAVHPTRISPDFHDIVYMEDGAWDFKVNGRVYDVGPGDVFVLPAGSVYEGVAGCIPKTRTVFIHTESLPEDYFDSECDNIRDDEKSLHLPLGNVIHTGNDQTVKSLFFEMAMLGCSDDPKKNIILPTLFNSLICFLYMCDQKTIVRTRDLVSECINIMRSSPDRFFKEGEMSDLLFVSSKTLRGSFIKRYNKTFYRFQLDYKLTQALSMIKFDPDIRIYEVAYALGFSDEFHLSKLFKKKYGVSPTEYKKRFSCR